MRKACAPLDSKLRCGQSASTGCPFLFLVLIHADFRLAAFRDPGAIHTLRIETPDHIALGIDGDDTSVALHVGELMLDDLVGGLLQAHAFVLNERADRPRYGETDEIFAGSGTRYGAGAVVRISPGSDDGRVAHAAPHLCRQSTG